MRAPQPCTKSFPITEAPPQISGSAALVTREKFWILGYSSPHSGAMRKRVGIALAVVLVALGGVVCFQILCPQEREPVYQGRALRFWLRDYAGWDIGPKAWAAAKVRAEDAVRQIGTNAIPNLLKMVSKTESPRMGKVTDFWDRHIANLKILPARVRHPAWYKNQPRYLNMEGEIGFKILGADAHEAVPELMSIYQGTLSMDSVAAMNSQIAVSRSLISIGPAAVPPLLKWAASTNEAERLDAIYMLSQIHAQPLEVVPVLIKYLSHTNSQVRIQVAEGLGNFGADSQQAVPA